MSFLTSKPKGNRQPNYTGIPVSTSVSTLPIAVGWGRSLLAPNLIDYVDFRKTTQSNSNSGGKGGGGGKGGANTTYTASIVMGLCEGPITSVPTVYKNQTVATNLGALHITLIYGNLIQAPWGYMASQHASHALDYIGVAYLVAANYDLGGSPAVPLHSMEVQFPLVGTASWINAYDADLALIVNDFLTNVQYGAGFPTAAINTSTLMSSGAAATTGDAALQTWCRANGMGFSPVQSSVETASSILDRWLTLALIAPVWSGKQLKFIPYGDSIVTGNGVTFLPNNTPLYNLFDDDFIGDSSAEPVTVSRIDPTDIYNVWRIEILDRHNAYNPVPFEARDQNDIEINPNGRRIATTITAHEVCEPGVGSRLVHLALRRGLSVRNTYAWKLSWEFCLLEPMDLVTIPDNVTGAALYARILTVDEDDNGELGFTAEEYPGGVLGTSVLAMQPTETFPVDTGVPADPIYPPIIFEPPPALVTTPQVWIAASGGVGGTFDANWGGAFVFVSTDDVSYEPAGEISAPARMGSLTASLPAFSGANPDTTDTLAVSLLESAGTLSGTSDGNAAAALTLCYADGELLSFVNEALTGVNTYALTGLYRGLYNSAAVAHASGTQFARLDDAIFKYQLPAAYIGQTIYIKLQSFNIHGQGVQDISTCAVYAYSLAGLVANVAPPTAVTATMGVTRQNDGTIQPYMIIGWTASIDRVINEYQYEYAPHGTTLWTGGTVSSNTTSVRIVPIPSGAYDVQVRAVRTNGPFYSAWAQALNVTTVGKTAPPPDPTGISAVGSYRSVTLSWVAAAESDIAWYEIWQGASSSLAAAAETGTVSATSTTIAGLALNTLYYFWLRSVDTSGNKGNFVGPASASTLPVDPATLAAGLEAVQVVSTIGSADHTKSIVAIATDTYKVYRWNGSAWITAVDGSDISAATIEGGSIVAGGIATLQLAAVAVTGDKITGNFIQGNTFTAGSGTGSGEILIDGSLSTISGLHYGPRILAFDDAGTLRFLMGQQGSAWGLWIYDAAGNAIFQESALGTNVVGTSNIVANNVTYPYGVSVAPGTATNDTVWLTLWSHGADVSGVVQVAAAINYQADPSTTYTDAHIQILVNGAVVADTDNLIAPGGPICAALGCSASIAAGQTILVRAMGAVSSGVGIISSGAITALIVQR